MSVALSSALLPIFGGGLLEEVGISAYFRSGSANERAFLCHPERSEGSVSDNECIFEGVT
jgi:hypothetical protein